MTRTFPPPHAVLEVTVLPWLPRHRSVRTEQVRESALTTGGELSLDPTELLVSWVLVAVVVVLAPVLAVVLTVLFLPLDLVLALMRALNPDGRLRVRYSWI